MSFPPVDPSRANAEGEVIRARERELEAKAERYARLHPDDEIDKSPDNAIRRALRRLRAAITSHK
jgi:hypothetical protein